jgi:hypothetical protein
VTPNAPARFQWRAFVTLFVTLSFVLAGAFHLYFNWRIFWSYLRSRLAVGIRMKRELALAALASAHDLTPEQVWVALKGEEKPKEPPAGGGYGRQPHDLLQILAGA